MLKIAILAVLYELSIVALVQERVVKVTVALGRAMIDFMVFISVRAGFSRFTMHWISYRL